MKTTNEHPSTGHPSILSRVVSGSVGCSVYHLTFTPLEVVKVRHQAAVRTQHTPSPSTSSAVTIFHHGRNAVVKKSGMMLPNRAFPWLVSPTLSNPVMAVNLSPVNRICARFFDTTSHFMPQAGSGIISTLRTIARTEGFTGLYKGLSPSLMAAVPNTAIYFTIYDDLLAHLRSRHVARYLVTEDEARRQLYPPFFSAALARLVSSVSTAPLELLKIRKANCRHESTSFVQEARLVLKESGPLGFYKGVGSTIMRDVPFSSLLFLSMEVLKTTLHDSNMLGRHGVRFYTTRDMQIPVQVHVTESLICSSLAGVIAVLSTTPFDLVKSIQQSQRASSRSQYNGTFALLRHIMREDGIQGLYRGNVIRLLKVVPGCAITIGTYELGKQLLRDL